MILGMSQASENSRRHRPRGGSLLVTHTAPAIPTPFCERVLRPERSTETSFIPKDPKDGSKANSLQGLPPCSQDRDNLFPTTSLLDAPITSRGVQLSILK